MLPLDDADTLVLLDSVWEVVVEELNDLSAVDETVFLGDAELLELNVIGDFEGVVLTVLEPGGDLEWLDDTVVVFVTNELLVSDTLIKELTDGDSDPLFDIWADSDTEADAESRVEIDGDPDTLYDSWFEYDWTSEIVFAAVSERLPVAVKRDEIVWVIVRISERVPVDVTEGVVVFVVSWVELILELLDPVAELEEVFETDTERDTVAVLTTVFEFLAVFVTLTVVVDVLLDEDDPVLVADL